MGGKARLEFLRGWIGIAIVNARERPAVALSFAVGAAAVLPAAVAAFSIAFFVFVVCFAALSLPIGATTAVWWVGTRVFVRPKSVEPAVVDIPADIPAAPAAASPRVAVDSFEPADATLATPRPHDPFSTTMTTMSAEDLSTTLTSAGLSDGEQEDEANDPTACLTHRGLDLRELSPGFLPNLASLSRVRVLDLGGNELGELPGLERLAGTLEHLRLSRNWFARVPPEVKHLKMLKELDMSRNFVRFTDEALPMNALGNLERLRVVDFRYNRKLFKQTHVDALRSAIPQAEVVRVTVSFPAAPGSFVGASPRHRDATSLRAQLEPWSTLALRRRLVEDFGESPTDPETVQRPEVMARLLELYEEEGGVEGRRVLSLEGARVSRAACDSLLEELRDWSKKRKKGARGQQQERPSISAESYMIVRSPTDFEAKLGAGSRKARQAADKFAKYSKLWALAESALREVDPAFADSFTALAVTHGFRGSPHIDKQNIGPFYGLALGTFAVGSGGVCVECDARTVAVVDTREKLGKVDGRFPHWVGPYDTGAERYSLIYYQTMGEPTPITTAVFGADAQLAALDEE
jgi:hypothetical protein